MTDTIRSRGTDPSLMTSRMFAQVFQAYIECSTPIQEMIREMVAIVNDPSATESERDMACSTIAEALFPSKHNGCLGADLEEVERLASNEKNDVQAAMDRQESLFADRVDALLRDRGMSQAQLAEAIGVGQPAISMLLSRKSRPQRRTVEKIANALGTSAADLWPEFGDPR